MRKILTYCSFVIATLAIIVAFVTAKTHIQLTIAIVFYPLLVYFALKVFPRKSLRVFPSGEVTAVAQSESKPVVDIDKRDFLKMIGVSGLSLLLYSIFLKKTQIPFFQGTSESGTVSLQDTAGRKIDPVEKEPTDGYRITEIDDSIIAYYGFTHKDGSWFIMQEDTETGSFRYVRGDADFSGNWTNRENFKYDYFINVF